MFNIHRNPSMCTASDNVPIQPKILPEAAAVEQTSAVPDIFYLMNLVNVKNVLCFSMWTSLVKDFVDNMSFREWYKKKTS